MPSVNVKALYQKYITKLALIAGLVILIGIGSWSFINMRSKLDATRSELLASKSLYSIILKEKQRLDSLELVYKHSIEIRDAEIAKKTKEIFEQDRQIDILRGSLADALDEVQQVTANNSYKYINLRIPPVAELKFPFDSTQVKKIHFTFIERDGLFNINNKLDSLVIDLKQMSLIKDNQILELKNLNYVYLSQREICNKESNAYKVEITGLNKSVKKQKFLKNTAGAVAVGAVGVIILHTIIK
jgi:hypothetical protein